MALGFLFRKSLSAYWVTDQVVNILKQRKGEKRYLLHQSDFDKTNEKEKNRRSL